MTGLVALVHHDLTTLFVVLAVVAFAVAIWRASLRDVLGCVLAAGVGLVLLLFA